jgi:hypothetical protein
MPAAPEIPVCPALLFPVDEQPVAPVRRMNPVQLLDEARHAAGLSRKLGTDCASRPQAAVEGGQNALGRQRIEGERRVADRDPALAMPR